MRLVADLHLHSKYAYAVSKLCDLEHNRDGAVRKGLNLLATGDFTHPKWFAEVKEKLEATEHDGLWRLKENPKEILWMWVAEVSTVYSTAKGVKKIHHLIHVKGPEEAAQLNDVFAKYGKLSSDGRPTLSKITAAQLVEEALQVVPNAVFVCAHAWTPWFGVFGSRGGYNSLNEAFEENSKRITAIETGMSSDPAMNWRISGLDDFGIMSGSDAHSPHPWRIGREASVFDFEKPSFDAIWKAVKHRDEKHFVYTIETDPAYGRYHWDGHRAHDVSMPPEETKKLNGICPVCHKPLVIGVENRVEELADRPLGFKTKNAIPFKTLLPLHELIANAHNTGLYSPFVMTEGDKLINKFGNELAVLLEATEKQIIEAGAHEKIARLVLLNREGKIKVKPGYDGEYGVPQLPPELIVREKRERAVSKKTEEKKTRGQLGLNEF